LDGKSEIVVYLEKKWRLQRGWKAPEDTLRKEEKGGFGGWIVPAIPREAQDGKEVAQRR
jgi:hypothetical protein